MEAASGHLTYCTNIHPGETWQHHFDELRKHVPAIKSKVSPDHAFGIGLRLSHLASIELGSGDNLSAFKRWLDHAGCYVFTMNGFPYGGFHHTRVKDQVHSPDWTTQDRVLYTLQLFRLLSALLPEGLEGGISTSPLSYRRWHPESDRGLTIRTATENMLKVVEELVRIKQETGQTLHIDIEPEPDGLLESGAEFADWYQEYLLPQGEKYLKDTFALDEKKAGEAIHDHVQLCYDVCHFAVGYEDHTKVLRQLERLGIRVGKIQISAALRAPMPPLPADRGRIMRAFEPFNEDTYLHQVIALQEANSLIRYSDLPEALADAGNTATREWRSHFHVPVFVKDFGVLKSTQEDIETVLTIHRETPLTRHLEVETYTWEVLPPALRLSVDQSIIRELEWVKERL